jgi:hypothetical protein
LEPAHPIAKRDRSDVDSGNERRIEMDHFKVLLVPQFVGCN